MFPFAPQQEYRKALSGNDYMFYHADEARAVVTVDRVLYASRSEDALLNDRSAPAPRRALFLRGGGHLKFFRIVLYPLGKSVIMYTYYRILRKGACNFM